MADHEEFLSDDELSLAEVPDEQREEALRQLEQADPEQDVSSREKVLKAAAAIGGAALVAGAVVGWHRHVTKSKREVSLGKGDRHDKGMLATFVDMAGDLAASFPSKEDAIEPLVKDGNYKRIFAKTAKDVVYPLKGDPEHVKEYARRAAKVRAVLMDILSSSKKTGEK